MGANRKMRRRMDKAVERMRKDNRRRGHFRVEMGPKGHIAESVSIQPQDARVMIRTVEKLLASLRAQLEQHQAADAALAQRAAQAVAGQPRASAAALKHFAPKEDA